MNRLSLQYAVLALGLAACADGAAPSADPDFARRWFKNSIVVQEDVVNPCNGQTMHLTSRFTYADAYDQNGRQQGRFTVAGEGTSDDGTSYTLRSLSHADAVPYESEIAWIHEQVTASAPGGSYSRKVLVQFHLDGTGEVHELLDERETCR